MAAGGRCLTWPMCPGPTPAPAWSKRPSMELAPHNITANAVSPGSIDTVRGPSAGGPHGRGLAREIPLGRQGTAEEIAAMVRFLADPEGRYITGQTIHVNGGLFFGK